MAIKTAESDALKRAAINLGTQFGLSLYNNGSTADIIRATLVMPADYADGKDAPTEPVKAPVADEQPVHESEQGSVSIDVATALAEFSVAADILDNASRILEVAALKQSNAEHLDSIVTVDGSEMTIGRYADLIAGGAYTPKEQQ